MKLISLLVALLLIGLLIAKQLKPNSSSNDIENILGSEKFTTPKVPTSPQELQAFENDINKLIQDSADKRARELEESLNKKRLK